MSKALKGITIWILALFSVLSGANVVNAVIMWFNLGPESTFLPYLIGDITGAIPVYMYILVSLIVTAVFLGATSHKIVTESSYADKVNAIIRQVIKRKKPLHPRDRHCRPQLVDQHQSSTFSSS